MSRKKKPRKVTRDRGGEERREKGNEKIQKQQGEKRKKDGKKQVIQDARGKQDERERQEGGHVEQNRPCHYTLQLGMCSYQQNINENKEKERKEAEPSTVKRVAINSKQREKPFCLSCTHR